MWYHESVTLSVGATRTRRPFVGGELGGAGRESLGDHAVGVEWHVRAVLLGRADREQHGVDAGLDLSPDLLPRHPLDQVLRHGRLV